MTIYKKCDTCMWNGASDCGPKCIGNDPAKPEFKLYNPKKIYARPAKEVKDHDVVNHPKHYTGHPSGVECIEITEHFNFCVGNAMKYLWRGGIKTEDPTEDYEKAIWYIKRELDKLKTVY